MSLILKGIDMPKKGTNIVLTIYGRDGTYDAKTYPRGVRIKDEAIQIPKNHGRIGDLDELQKAIRTDIMGGLNYGYFIRNAPTILEAEE